ncbi:SphA family protein [Variovorax boronicumulans]|uniref:SphA family protein n=1 Tax=Variovorax boronicumulans TaxID=436515 RepID=UPI00339ABC6F
MTLTAAAVGLTALAVLGAQSACAFEGGISPFPAGSTGEYIAALPPIPGLFAVEQFNYSSSNGLYDNNGNKRPIPFSSSVYSATTRLLASYPTTVWGANVYSQLVLPAVSLHTDVAGHSETHRGMSNITVTPVMLRWALSPYANVTTGLDIALPSGSYSPNRSSVAVGYTSWQPVVAYRYNEPNGFDAGISNRLLLNQKNSDTNYRSGSAYVADFTAGWNFGKWKVGVVGAYLNQFSDDRQNGAVVNGNRTRSFAVGPSIAYNAGPFSISVNYQQGIYAVNTAKSNALWVNLAIPLWVKQGL